MPASRLIWLLLPVFFTPGLQAQNSAVSELSPKLRAAKAVYFLDETGSPKVGDKAREELKKWGRFAIVQDRMQADIVLVLSSSPYNGGNVILASGETGHVGAGGQIAKDPIPNFNKAAPVRHAYSAVLDRSTGEVLWSDSRAWGGLLTGFNSAGTRLVKKL